MNNSTVEEIMDIHKCSHEAAIRVQRILNNDILSEDDVIAVLNGKRNSPYKKCGDANIINENLGNCEIKRTWSSRGIARFSHIRIDDDCNYILIDVGNQYVYYLTKKQMHDEIFRYNAASPAEGQFKNQNKDDPTSIRLWAITLDYRVKKPKLNTQEKFKRFKSYRNSYLEKMIFGS